MKHSAYIYLTSILMLIPVLGFAINTDNVVITSVVEEYKLKAGKDGRLASVKAFERLTYKALEYNDNAIAFVSYGDGVTVDKAAAPHSKPVYSQKIGEDIFYEDHRICMLPIRVEVGKEVEAVFERTLSDPTQFCDIPLTNIYDVNSYKIIVEMPKQLASTMQLVPINFPDDAQITKSEEANGAVVYTFVLRNLKGISNESMKPSPVVYSPMILVTGYFPDIQSLYEHLRNYIDKEEPSDQVCTLARELTQGMDNDYDKIDAIATWVRQNIRYLAIEHGEYGFRPATASSVLADRFGDCKGSANLIKTMLKCAGLDGRLVWIGTKGSTATTCDDYPSIGSGNHMIAACVINDTIVYIDGTVKFAPKGYIPPTLYGQKALIEDGDTYMLRQVPTIPLSINTDSLSASYSLGDDLRLRGEYVHTLRGHHIIAYDNLMHDVTASKRDKALDYLVRGSKKGMTVDDVRFERESANSSQAYLYAKVTDESAAKKAGSRVLLTLPVIDCSWVQTFDTSKRVSPISMKYPERYVAVLTLDMGDRASSLDKPDDVSISNPWFEGSIKYDIQGSSLIVEAELTTYGIYVPIEDISEWNDTVRQAKKVVAPVIKFN